MITILIIRIIRIIIPIERVVLKYIIILTRIALEVIQYPFKHFKRKLFASVF